MNKADLKVGDHVSFLRSANKAVSLTGRIVKIHEGDVPCVDVQLDERENWIETAHVDDVTLLEEAAAPPADGKSLRTYNGKPV